MATYLDDLEIIDGPELVSAYDELSLWSAPFGRLLLDHVPMRRGMKVLDVGCGSCDPSGAALAERNGFVVEKVVEDRFTMRFADGDAFLRHHFVRLAFLGDWVEVLRGEDASWILAGLSGALDARADLEGGLELTVPMAYVEARRG